ncbi:GapA-binding peptide SR1P [Bacillus sp. FJAT-44742]|nr:GapA-binding peptide SR1P [Bacillus sp. FJAT-44742]
MGIIVCQTCNRTIEHFDGEKVATLYAVSSDCEKCETKKATKK